MTMTNIAPVEGYQKGEIQREDLRYFHEMSGEEKAVEWEKTRDYLAKEAKYFENTAVYPHLEAIDSGINSGSLVPIHPSEGLYGIVSPIRNRYSLPGSDTEGSVPYLDPRAATVLSDLSSDIKRSCEQSGIKEILESQEILDFRISLTSLTRTSAYQRIIAMQGRLAVGLDGGTQHSVHEMGLAFDIDHSGLYVTPQNGIEIALNRDAGEADFNRLATILPAYRKQLRNVIETYQQNGTVLALEEVPNGWGAWHVAVIPQ